MHHFGSFLDLQLTQIIPMFDDDTGAEPSIVFSSFADPFMLLIRSDQSAVVYRCDNQSMEVEEVERADSFKVCISLDIAGRKSS